MQLRKIIIAVDGYSACGKSSTAKRVATALGYRYIDTGAMYRAVTLYFQEHHIRCTNPKEVKKALGEIQITFHLNAKGVSEVFLNGLNVEGQIRTMKISAMVSEVAAVKEVRVAMVEQQRKMGRSRGVVMDGRDIGTVVFPEAELKVFMTADLEIRAARRQQELLEMKQLVDLEEVLENLKQRDIIDTNRAESPLKQAEDALLIDTSYITLEEQIDEVVRLAVSRIVAETT